MRVPQALFFLLVTLVASQLLSQTSPPVAPGDPNCGTPPCTWIVFGPHTFTRQPGAPRTVVVNFPAPAAVSGYTLRVRNQGAASGELLINGEVVLGASDFNPQVVTLDRALTLQESNTLAVTLRSKPGSSIAVEIVGVAAPPPPPSISAEVSPLPNQNGWNCTDVTVSFACSPGSAPVTNCTPPHTFTNEGEAQTIEGSVGDASGQVVTTTVAVDLDKTAPAVSIATPANGITVAYNRLPMTGSLTDALSGIDVDHVTCNGAPARVSRNSFSCAPPLIEGENEIVVLVADRAGNVASATIHATRNSPPPVPAAAILFTPARMAMLVNDQRPLALVDDQGRRVTDATWSVNDPTIATVTAENAILALAPGTSEITATWNGMTATATVTVYPGTELPVGTHIFEISPSPGQTTSFAVAGDPEAGGAAMYLVEGEYLRAFERDGTQLWISHVGSTATAATAGPPPNDSPLHRLLDRWKHWEGRKHRPATADFMRTYFSPNAPGILPGDDQSDKATAAALLSPIRSTVPDHLGGTVNLLWSFGSPQGVSSSVLRIDGDTGRESWRYDSPGSVVSGFGIGHDGTVVITEYSRGPFSTQTGANVIGIDGVSGAVKFTVPLEMSRNIDANSQEALAWPLVSPVTVLEDGRAAVLYAHARVEQTSNLGYWSIHRNVYLKLLHVDAYGRSATTELGNRFLQEGSYISHPHPDPSYFGIEWTEDFVSEPMPMAVIPDGSGGELVQWTQYERNGYHHCIEVWDPPGIDPVCSPYVTPEMTSRVSRLGSIGWDRAFDFNPPQWPGYASIVLGDEDTAVITHTRSSGPDQVSALDLNAHALKWTWNGPGDAALLSAMTGGGLAVDAAGQLLTFDAFGGPSPWNLGITNPVYFGDGAWLGRSSDGSTALAAGPGLLDHPSVFPYIAGTRAGRRAPDLCDVPSDFPPLCDPEREIMEKHWTKLYKFLSAPNSPEVGSRILNYVFYKLIAGNDCDTPNPVDSTCNLKNFLIYMRSGHRFYNGTKSTVSYRYACGFFCISPEMRTYFANNTDTNAVAVTPSWPFEVFFRPVVLKDDVDTQARLFHEALHGFTGFEDDGLRSKFLTNPPVFGPTVRITEYIRDCVLAYNASRCAEY